MPCCLPYGAFVHLAHLGPPGDLVGTGVARLELLERGVVARAVRTFPWNVLESEGNRT